MAFLTEFIDITQFRPDPENFDEGKDLIRIGFENSMQQLYVSYLGEWAVAMSDPTLPESFRELMRRPAYMFKDTEGLRIDQAIIGKQALFSLMGREDTNLWRSELAVGSLTPVRRRINMRSTVRFLNPR